MVAMAMYESSFGFGPTFIIQRCYVESTSVSDGVGFFWIEGLDHGHLSKEFNGQELL